MAILYPSENSRLLSAILGSIGYWMNNWMGPLQTTRAACVISPETTHFSQQSYFSALKLFGMWDKRGFNPRPEMF